MQPGPSSFVVQPPAGVPAKVLIAELPDVTAGSLVPLAEVVDACVHEIYKRLSELQDILPALHDKARAREVFQFALWARRECVRLLAVVRWCREGDAVSRALVRPDCPSNPLPSPLRACPGAPQGSPARSPRSTLAGGLNSSHPRPED